MITADEKLAGPIVEEYFSLKETYDQASFYDDLSSWAKLGEDPFPTVADTKADLTGGELINGTDSDFVVIETPGEGSDPDPSVPVVGTLVAYTPNSTFVSTFTASSVEYYSSGDAIYDDFGIDEISVNTSFFTVNFKDAASMTAWRATGRSVDLAPDDTSKVWKGTRILASSTEYSVNTSFNYIHYAGSLVLGSISNNDDFARYLAEARSGNSVCDFTFE